jgi:hypothetical protein
MSAVPDARFAGSPAGARPAEIATYSGAAGTDRVKIPYEWLEFYDWGIRLRGRGPFRRLVATCDICYADIAELVVLIATIEPRKRGIRLKTARGSGFTYFFTRPAIVPQLLGLFRHHGVEPDGQVTRSRIPYSLGYIYPESAPVESLQE